MRRFGGGAIIPQKYCADNKIRPDFVVCAIFLWYDGAAAKTPHAVRQALGSSVCGIATLGAAALLAPFTGLSLAVNWFTAFAAVVLGAPGVVTMLLLRVLLAAG